MFQHNFILITSIPFYFFPKELSDRCWCKLSWSWWVSPYWFQVIDFWRHTWSCIHLLHEGKHLLFKVEMRLLKLLTSDHPFRVLSVHILLLLTWTLPMGKFILLFRWNNSWFAFFQFSTIFSFSFSAAFFSLVLIVIFEVFQLHKCNLAILWIHQILMTSWQLSSTLWLNHVPRLNKFLFFIICNIPYYCFISIIHICCLIQSLETAWFHDWDISSKIWLALLQNRLHLSFFGFSRRWNWSTLLLLMAGLCWELRLVQVIWLTQRGAVLHIDELRLCQLVEYDAWLVAIPILCWMYRGCSCI